MANGNDIDAFLQAGQDEPEDPIEDFLSASVEEEEDSLNTFLQAEPEEEIPELSFTQRLGIDLSTLPLRQQGVTGIAPQTRFMSGVNALIQGIGDLPEGLMKGVAAINKNLANNLAEAAKGAKPGTIREDILAPGSVEDYALFQAGQSIRDMLNETFPENKEFQGEFLASTLPRGFGTFIGQTGAALATGGAASAGLTAIAFSGLEYDQALEATGDEEKAFQTMMLNMPVNSLEQLPVLVGLSKLNRSTGGGFVKLFKRLAQTRTGTGLIEGVQEVSQEYTQNLIAKNMYDETRDLIAGLDQAGAAGIIIGMTARSLGISFRQRLNDPDATPQERAEAYSSLQFLHEETSRMVREGRLEHTDFSRMGDMQRVPRMGPLFDPDAAPTAEDFLTATKLEEDVNQETESSFDVKPEQSSIVLDQKDQNSWQRLKRKFKHWLAPEGKFPKEVYQTMREFGDLDREMKRMTFVARDLRDALRSEYNISRTEEAFYSNKIPKKTIRDMRKYMLGETSLETIPEGIRLPVRHMRDHVNLLSRIHQKLGISEGDLDLIVKEDLGLFIHRTYKVHSQPDWADKVPEDIKRRAYNFIKQEYEKAGIELKDNQIKNKVYSIAEEGDVSPIRVILEGDVDSKDVNPLNKEKDIPKVIRELMGEETNPIVNYAKSINAIANQIQHHKVMTELAERYKGVYFFDPEADNIPEDASAIITPNRGSVLAPLTGLKTSPEIAEAFKEMSQSWKSNSKMIETYLKLNAGAKFAKTVLNPTTISRNVIGGSFFLMASGHNPLGSNFKKGYEAARSAFRNPGSAEGRARILKYAEYKLLGTSPQAGEVMDLAGDISQAENYDQLTDFMMGKGLKSKGIRAIKKASDFYQAGDNLMRVIFFESELQNQKQIYGDTKTEQEMEQDAANITNELYQDYSQVPKFVRNLRKAPIAPFIAFQYEVARTSINLVNRIRTEINSTNPRERQVGYKRLAGASLVSGVGMLGASAVSKMLLGITDDEEEDVRRFAAPWDKNSTLIFLDSARGEARFMNGSYLDPYEYLKDPILLALTGRGEDDFGDALLNSFRLAFEPLWQEEIFIKQFREVVSNSTAEGGTVFNPQDTIGRQWADRLLHLWEAFEPGAVRAGSNIYESVAVDDSDRAPGTEILGLFGLRITKVDFERGLAFKARDFSKDKRNAKRIYNTAKFDEDANILEKEEALYTANNSYRELFNELSRDIDAARRQGVLLTTIEKQLEDNGVAKSEVDRLIRHSFERFER